jgi:electron transport complex protein RnfC
VVKKCSFKGGIHIPYNKDRTSGKAAELVPSPKQVVIPLNQHFGVSNKAIVAVGDTVKRGQKIACADAPVPMSVPVHASIAGIVKKIEPRLLSNNTEGICIVIESDPSVSGDEFMPPLDPFNCSKDEAFARIQEAGIVGMGGAGFPAHIKIDPPPEKKIDFIIADGAECEAYLTTDEAAIRSKADAIVNGLAILMAISGVNTAIIGMEDNKADLVPTLEKAIENGNYPGSITVSLCQTRYPQGGEKLLIKALTGREVPSGGLPADAGCIVQNVGTLLAISEAFTLGRPLIKRGLTVSGGACAHPRNIIAPIGTVLGDFDPEYFAIDYDKLDKIIFGGPMMGSSVPHANIPIQKNTSGILFLSAAETYTQEENACIRCGRCVKDCSIRLYPVLMNNALEAGDFEEAMKIGLLDCIECGSCTFNCPARIRLVQRFRVGKFKLRNYLAAKKARAEAKAAASKLRS